MKGKFFDRTLLNKRITVDYKKEKVDFEEVTEKSFIERHPFLHIFFILFSFYMILFVIFSIIGAVVLGAYILIKTVSLNVLGQTTSTFVLSMDELILFGGILGIALSILLLPPFIVTILLYYKFPDKIAFIPQLLYYRDKYIFREEEMKVVVTTLNSKIYEIPLFSNFILQYNAEGDFSKYLEKVEIKEHPFKALVIKGFTLKILIQKILKRKIKVVEKQDDSLWRALFTFSAVPKTGKLTIWFI